MWRMARATAAVLTALVQTVHDWRPAAGRRELA